MTIIECRFRLFSFGRLLEKSGDVAGNMPLVRLLDDDCKAALLVKAHARPGRPHTGAKAAGMVGGLSPVPFEPLRASCEPAGWGLAGLAEVFFPDCETPRNVTDLSWGTDGTGESDGDDSDGQGTPQGDGGVRSTPHLGPRSGNF